MEYFKVDLRTGDKKIQQITHSSRRAASYFTLIELNKRFLTLAVRMHNVTLDMKSAPDAIAKISNDFGRATTFHIVMISLLMRNTGQFPKDDHRKFAAALEALIVEIQDRIYSLGNKFSGDFSNHPLAKFRVYNRDDFKQLTDMGQSFNVNDYVDIWMKHRKALLLSKSYFDVRSNEKKLNKRENEIRLLIDELLRDPLNAKNEHKGDLIITLNSPNSAKILAHDKLFLILGSMLDKNFEYVDDFFK